jgi:hypothetical protein
MIISNNTPAGQHYSFNRGVNEKARFIKIMIFGSVMKTVKIDKVAMDYYM